MTAPLRVLLLALPCAAGLACSGSPPATTTPQPRAAPAAPSRATPVALRNDWRATVFLQRIDSLVFTLPNGAKQVQRVTRAARFSLAVSAGNGYSVTLDSMTLIPAAPQAVAAAIGTTWSGRILGNGRLDGVKASRTTAIGEDLAPTVLTFLPPVPFAGAAVGATWRDSVRGSSQVEVFRVNEQRTRTWTVGERADRSGLPVHPVRVREEFEQVGRGSQAGREMTMTAQGKRSGTYYLTLDGRIDGATFDDSVARLITIPASKQTIPTMQYSRTTLRFVSRADRP